MCRAPAASGVAQTCKTTICGASAFQPPLRRGSQPSHTGCAPDREPPGQVLLPLQVVADHALDLQLERAVPALAGQRGERVERAPLVQVDEGEAALLVVPEGDQGTQQLRAEAVVDQRG